MSFSRRDLSLIEVALDAKIQATSDIMAEIDDRRSNMYGTYALVLNNLNIALKNVQTARAKL